MAGLTSQQVIGLGCARGCRARLALKPSSLSIRRSMCRPGFDPASKNEH